MTTANYATDAEALIDYRARARVHGASERVPDIDGVMATIVDPAKLTWTRTLCWATNALSADEPSKLLVYTTPEEIRTFYEELLDRDELAGARPTTTDIRSSWYTFSEALGTGIRNRHTGEETTIDSAVMAMFDGGEKVSAEICWIRAADVTLDAPARAQLWVAYLTALREADAEAAVATMSPHVQGAVRDYFDADPPFVGIDGAEAMRAHYEKLFAHVEVLDINVIRLAVQGWFVFAEMNWTVRLRQGDDAGREVQFLTAEHLPYGSDGRFQARLGFGTDME